MGGGKFEVARSETVSRALARGGRLVVKMKGY